MCFQILLNIGVILFQRALTRSISNGTIDNRIYSLERYSNHWFYG